MRIGLSAARQQTIRHTEERKMSRKGREGRIATKVERGQREIQKKAREGERNEDIAGERSRPAPESWSTMKWTQSDEDPIKNRIRSKATMILDFSLLIILRLLIFFVFCSIR